jgi:hypothetical protein
MARLRHAQVAACVLLAALACMALATRWAGISGLGTTLLLTSVPAAFAGLWWAYSAGEDVPASHVRQQRLMLLATGVEVLLVLGMLVAFVLSPETYLPG